MTNEPTCYRLDRAKGGNTGAKGGGLWAAFTPEHGLKRTWQMSVSARGRGGAKVLSPLLETGARRPLATVTIKGEAFPLPIDWHGPIRGGGLRFGGGRKLGTDGGTLDWEMRWTPVAGEAGGFAAEMRLRATPRRSGSLRIDLPVPLYRPEFWRLPGGRGGACAWSDYSAHYLSVVAGEGASLEWTEPGGFTWDLPAFALGGGKIVRFGLRFGAAATFGAARAALVTQYAGWDAPPAPALGPLDPARTVARLVAPDAHDVQGLERLYLKPPVAGEEGSHYAGFPHEPAGALKALWDHGRLHTDADTPRLVRFGAQGICADFQVLGRGDESEPNKGAFWDKKTFGAGTDSAGGATHGLLSNARLARSLFQLHAATGEPLLRQSALNICQWLLLKQNGGGFYDGARVHATRGLPGDGRFLPQPCALDGAEAIRAFVLAYRATGNEVWIKASWRIAEFLLGERGRDFDDFAPASVAGVLLSLLALDAESPNPRLRAALAAWGAWLRVLPLDPGAPSVNPDGLNYEGRNYDGLHAGLYDCAQAAFGLYGLTRDLADLRYAFAALGRVPEASRAASWRSVAAHQSALLALAGLLPGAKIDFDAPSVTLDWRVFAPDPAAAPGLRVRAAGGADAWADWLPLVCRGTDQLLLLVLAAPDVEAVSVWKNGKRPLARDLRTGALDTDTRLRPVGPGAKDGWARVGLFTVDP